MSIAALSLVLASVGILFACDILWSRKKFLSTALMVVARSSLYCKSS